MCHIHSALGDQLLHDLHPLGRLRPFQRAVCHIAFQHATGTACLVGGSILCQRRQPIIRFALQKQRARCARDLPRPAGARLAQESGITDGKDRLCHRHALSALQHGNTSAAAHDQPVCLLVPIFHAGAGRGVGALGVNQKLVQIGGVIVVGGSVQKALPRLRRCCDPHGLLLSQLKYILRFRHLDTYLSNSSELCSCRSTSIS